ncbi:MAG: TrmH family RNA methyltransferase [Chitinophagaceae bacterium]
MLTKSRVKYIQTLGQKKFRQETGCFIAEGPKIVAELLQARRNDVLEVFATAEWIGENRDLMGSVEIVEVKPHELAQISQLTTPNMVLARVRQFDLPAGVDTKERVVLALDAIRDPGNMGTLLRIADWFGVEQVVCSEDSTDIYNPKVVQASMGSIARVHVFRMDLSSWLSSVRDTRIYAAVLDGRDIRTLEKMNSGIILVGNESKGIGPELLGFADTRITIPRKGHAESLNAAVATGIILSQLT